MHHDILDILSNNEIPISNEQLVKYLTGELSHEESHAIERQLEQSRIGSDALEGLMLLKNKNKAAGYRQEIRNELFSLLQHEPVKRKSKMPLFPQTIWLWLIIVLGIALAAYLLIAFIG